MLCAGREDDGDVCTADKNRLMAVTTEESALRSGFSRLGTDVSTRHFAERKCQT